MYAGAVQGIIPSFNTQEPGALLKSFGPQLRHFQKLPAALEPSVFLPVGHDILCDHRGDPGHIGQKRRRRSVEIHAHFIYTVLHYTGEGFA